MKVILVTLFLVLSTTGYPFSAASAASLRSTAARFDAAPADDSYQSIQTVLYGIEGLPGDGSENGFTSELAAVVAATDRYNPLSIAEDREYMGMILEKDDRYFYTVKPGRRRADRVTIRVRKPRSVRISAFWHTHGTASRERMYFSKIDMRLVRSSDRPLYLGDHTGHLSVFAPKNRRLHADQKDKKGFGARRRANQGNLVRDELGHVVRVATR